jgi:spore maturation protein CgeB
MKILYAGARQEGYDPSRRGMSFEYQNFYRTLDGMAGIQAIEFPFDKIMEWGKKIFREKFLEAVLREKPEAVFLFMYTDELDAGTLARARRELGIPVIMWFADDYWRFWNYSRYFAPHATLAVTTSAQAFRWYKKAGINNVVLSQWACNTRDFYPLEEIEQDIEVSFVGQYKAPRGRILKKLQEAGIRAEAFGAGWPRGRLSREELLSIFARSKINLNIAERPSLFSPRVLGRIFLRKSANRLVPDFHIVQNIQAWRHFRLPHIHARPFELAGCGAFVISSYVEGMENYYLPDQEMVFYRGREELIQKVLYYLEHPEERQRIAKAGYERTIKEHTYENRFREIFKTIGLPNG